MSFANLKKSIPIRKYRERSQPQARNHLGFLEKKKDYKVRAKNYHQKEDQLQKLRLKASLANKDEFYFGMQKSKIEDGIHVFEEDEEEDFDENEFKKIVKTQNQNIVKHQMYKDQKNVEQLKSNLQLLQAPRSNKQKFFVDKIEQLDKFDLAEKLDTEPEMLNQTYNMLKKSQIANMQFDEVDASYLAQASKNQYKKLANKMENLKKMQGIYLKLDQEKNLLNKEKKKIKKFKEGKIAKFFKERKR